MLPPPQDKQFRMATTSTSVEQITGDPVEYAYNDKTSLALGRGFNPSDVTGPAKASCVQWTPEPLNPGPPSTEFNVTYVNSYEELNFVMGLDTKVEASYLAASGAGSMKIDSSFLSKRNAITVIVTAKTNFGRWGLKAGATPTEQAKEWLKNPKLFEQRCGSRYVSFYRRQRCLCICIDHFEFCIK
jgi:hypothetical protein